MKTESENNKETPQQVPPPEPTGTADPPAEAPAEPVDPPTDAHCPNCNSPAMRKGKVIICQVCDASFRYTKDGPKVEELGPFDKLEERVTNLEGGKTQPPEPEPKPEPPEPQPAEPTPAEPEDDDEI